MTTKSQSETADDRNAAAMGVVLAALGPIAVAAALVSIRDQTGNTNVALVLVLVVLLAAVVGGRGAGVVAAFSAVLSFDFFHTQPYLSLTIDSRDDVITTVLLLPVGLIVGTLAARARSARRDAATSRDQMHRVHRLAEMTASGEDPAVIIETAQRELRELLRLLECRFEAPPYATELPILERSGVVLTTTHRYSLDGFELPNGGVSLPVLARGRPVGRFVLMPSPGTGVSLERRIVAVALADQVGGALWPAHERNSHA